MTPLPRADHSPASYRLVDFGDGRKLEEFAGHRLDRPSPAATATHPAQPGRWREADYRYDATPSPGWSGEPPPTAWHFRWESLVLELRLSGSGHVGLFPEQIANWRWLQSWLRRQPLRPRVLNLFGYTGGASLAAAAVGAEVTHVDASEPTVQWAKHNASLSGLAEAPIRWLVDDIRAVVRRARRRQVHYDMILMDPPTYGHGLSGKDWRLERDLPPLLEDCLRLLSDDQAALLVTGHSPIASLATGPFAAASWVQLTRRFPQRTRHRVGLFDDAGRRLDFGYAYRFQTPLTIAGE